MVFADSDDEEVVVVFGFVDVVVVVVFLLLLLLVLLAAAVVVVLLGGAGAVAGAGAVVLVVPRPMVVVVVVAVMRRGPVAVGGPVAEVAATALVAVGLFVVLVVRALNWAAEGLLLWKEESAGDAKGEDAAGWLLRVAGDSDDGLMFLPGRDESGFWGTL